MLDVDEGKGHLLLDDDWNRALKLSPGEAICGRALVEISDVVAVLLLTDKPPDQCPVCFPEGFKHPPDRDPPRRVSESWLMLLLSE